MFFKPISFSNALHIRIASLIIVLASAASAENSQPLGTITHPLDIGRHPSAALTNSEADAILADATQILSQCNSQFSRSGSVRSLNSLPSIISSQATFQSACQSNSFDESNKVEPLGVTRRVRIVNSINWCGQIGTGIIGCAFTPGTCMVMRRFTSSQEGIVWAHEFGHSKGLPHRTNSSDAVMFPSVGSNHTVFSTSECNRVRTLGFAGLSSSLNSTSDVLEALPITDFVKQSYPQGVPYNEARLYSSAEVDVIEPWLGDQMQSEHWTNVSTVIGIVASADSFQNLNDFVFSDGSGKLPIEQWDGRFSAIISVGYVVANNGDMAALRFLQERAVPASWNDVAWQAPFHNSIEETRNDLATAASLGLALAGEQGKEVIEDLLDNQFKNLAEENERKILLNSLLDEASRIERSGLSSYYGR